MKWRLILETQNQRWEECLLEDESTSTSNKSKESVRKAKSWVGVPKGVLERTPSRNDQVFVGQMPREWMITICLAWVHDYKWHPTMGIRKYKEVISRTHWQLGISSVPHPQFSVFWSVGRRIRTLKGWSNSCLSHANQPYSFY
jgi:hypothetical protein